jgi:hypothetical protein
MRAARPPRWGAEIDPRGTGPKVEIYSSKTLLVCSHSRGLTLLTTTIRLAKVPGLIVNCGACVASSSEESMSLLQSFSRPAAD